MDAGKFKIVIGDPDDPKESDRELRVSNVLFIIGGVLPTTIGGTYLQKRIGSHRVFQERKRIQIGQTWPSKYTYKWINIAWYDNVLGGRVGTNSSGPG